MMQRPTLAAPHCVGDAVVEDTGEASERVLDRLYERK
jgi:hypothetical protein